MAPSASKVALHVCEQSSFLRISNAGLQPCHAEPRRLRPSVCTETAQRREPDVRIDCRSTDGDLGRMHRDRRRNTPAGRGVPTLRTGGRVCVHAYALLPMPGRPFRSPRVPELRQQRRLLKASVDRAPFEAEGCALRRPRRSTQPGRGAAMQTPPRVRPVSSDQPRDIGRTWSPTLNLTC
jgi:hypothetical protein